LIRLLITRPIAEPVIAQARAHFDVTVSEAGALDPAAAGEALQCYDAILPTLGDLFSAVQVTNTPDVLTDATADIALTLLLATARRAGEGERLVRSGKWGGFGPKDLLGTQVTGKTVAIIGMGRIGQAIARRCHFGFGMDVVFYNRSTKAVDVPATQLPSLHAAMGAADFVVVATPGGAETTHLINADALAAMQPSGIFINISRGEVVDETALIAALQAGQIAGAGLDVYEHEPVVPDALKAMDNCVLLPHLGSATRETRQAMGQMALDNIIAWSQGRKPPQLI